MGLNDTTPERRRGWRRREYRKNRVYVKTEFVNPFPWMSHTEARVALWLQAQAIPYSWRYFNGDAPNFTLLVPDFTPEFTLRDYKIVILILGTYWGQVPGVLDKNSLAAAALEGDGYKVGLFWEDEIVRDVSRALTTKFPELARPSIHGGEYKNPWGVVAYKPNLARIAKLKAFNLRRFKAFDPEQETRSRAYASRRLRHRSRTRRTRANESPLPAPTRHSRRSLRSSDS